MRILLTLLLLALAAQPAAGDPMRYEGRPVAAVIDGFRDQGYAFVYSTNLVGADMLVTAEPAASDPVDIVREILAPYGLTVRSEAGVHLVIRVDRPVAETAGIVLIITGDATGHPLGDPDIAFDPPLPPPIRLNPGIWEYTDVPPGRYELAVSAPGFGGARRIVDLWAGESRIVSLNMATARPEIETIAVSASRYEIMRDLSVSRYAIDQRTIETMPDFGDDPLRVIQRLPGAAASGASARTHLRGGVQDEIGIVLNGQRLFDPFHVRDYQSVFSTVDSRAIEGVEVYTGGFPVRYGNRMSGMVLMESLEPLEGRHTEIGLSVYNTSILAAGSADKSSWLFSARRGNLDLVIDPEYGSPSYYDVFAEYAWSPTPDITVSINGLYADDRVEIILESDPEELERVVSDTGNAQLWLQIDNRWSDTLSSKTVLSATRFDNLRRGSLGDEEKIVASVYDDRRVREFGLRQDFAYHPSDRHLLQWGLQVTEASADYDYRNAAEYFGLPALFDGFDEPRSTAARVSPEGARYALYFADRWKLSATTALEWGLRWDDQTYTGLASDSQVSPRLSLMRTFGRNTELRASWGRYHQSQEINELQVEDGVTAFWPAQRADHFIVGLRHLFNDRYAMRVELFDKRIDDVRPRYENLFDPLGLIPEVQPDRVRLEPSSARSRGIEISVDRQHGPVTWWATYVLSEATDRIYGVEALRSWDQRHAVLAGLNYASEKWEWGVAASVHTGWPSTELFLVEDGVDEDGEPLFVAIPGTRNAGHYPTFATIDMRLARRWKLERGLLTAFVEVSNLTNRRNQCCLDWDLLEDETTGEEGLERGVDYWMPLLPAIGILWEF